MTGIVALAQRFARHRRAELAVFELLGVWATDPDTDPRTVATVAAQCQHHGWHAELFAARMPSVPAVDDVLAVTDEIEAALARTRAATTTHDRLALVHSRLLPALIAEYEQHLATIDPRVDGPSARALTLALRDLADDRQQLAELLDQLA